MINRILYVTSVDISRPNGPGVNEREFVLEFLRSPGFSGHAVLPLPGAAVAELPLDRCTFIPANGSGLSGFLRQQWRLFRASRAIAKRLGVDLIVARLSVLPIGIGFSLRNTGTPYVIKTLGGGVIDGVAFDNSMPRAIAKTFTGMNRSLVQPLLNKATAIDVCTEELRQRVVGGFGVALNRVVCIPNATNTERFQPRDVSEARRRVGLAADAPVVGFVGGMPSTWGGREMVRVAPRLAQRFPDVRFVIVGADKGLPELKQLAVDLGVQDRVIFTGTIPYDDVPGYVNTFDVGVALDVPGRGDLVGHSFQKVRQYLASGVPTIATTTADLDLEALGFGSRIPAGDLDEFERAVERWLSLAPTERAAFRQRASNYAHQHLSVKSALARRLEHWETSLAFRNA